MGRSLTLVPLPKGGATMSKKTRELLGTWIGKRNVDKLQDTKELIGKSANLEIVHQGGWANINALDPAEKDLPLEPYVRRTKDDWQGHPKNGDTPPPPGDGDAPGEEIPLGCSAPLAPQLRQAERGGGCAVVISIPTAWPSPPLTKMEN